MTQTALILGGSGKIGAHAKRAFEAAGWRCRMYERKAGNMAEAAMGCDVIVNGLNPPNYHNWAELIPAITEEVIAAAKASGATVILPGNVYVFGNTGGTWSEDTPHRPTSRKGVIRAEMEVLYAQSGVQVINLRAGNFIDPDKNGDVFSMLIVPKLAKGKVGAMGDPATLQAYAYLPDWARAAVMLAEKRAELGGYEDIPFAGHAFSLDALKADMEQITGRVLRYSAFPWRMMRLAAPFWELARELVEMRYLWNTPHALSGRKLKALLPEFEDTPLRDVLRQFDINPDKAMAAGREGERVA
ncbi:epimerase [Lentibacter sp. XHP0401]|uniref:epimerase n=1 Tax=Lentibacter sp. XHP0401 TaxID=2984334 RepID=UPI0021E8A906|nr:epimerase [Lentibacter sp. XHP0401]MCV2894936.1 epimerase [Lentibacter sp. XHP0401]